MPVKIYCKTLFDITRTAVHSRRNRLDGGDGDTQHARQRGQQSNYETLIQIISMRAQPESITDPEKTMEILGSDWGTNYLSRTKIPVWSFSFEIEQSEVYNNGVNQLGFLLADCQGVPMIKKLDEWSKLGDNLDTTPHLANIRFIVEHKRRRTKKHSDGAVNTAAHYVQLRQVVEDTLGELAADVLIKTGRGIVVYNNYLITGDGGDLHWRTVYNRAGDRVGEFPNEKLALIWAILEYHRKYYESGRVLHLSRMLSGVTVEIAIYGRLQRGGDQESRFIHEVKLDTARDRYRQILRELDKYTIVARVCQEKRNKSCN